MELSVRLETILSLIPECGVLADIGTDHGFIPIEAVRRGRAMHALACDVVPGPLERAAEHIARSGLNDRIETRLGDGLKPLSLKEAGCGVIAGMGGRLILRLLEESRDIAESMDTLILSPHTDVPEVRRALSSFGRRIEAERMAEEDGKFYFVMRTVPGKETLSEKEILFGPVLLSERPPVFLRWLEKERRKTLELLESLSKTDSERTREVLSEKQRFLVLIERALNDTEEG